MTHILPINVVQKIWDYAFGAAKDADAAKSNGVYEDGIYYPSPMDVCITRLLLTRGTKVPAFVVDSVLDFAEYWVRSSNEIDFMVEHGSPLLVSASGKNEDRLLIRSYPLGLTELSHRNTLSEELAYNTITAPPKTLKDEHDPSFFQGQATYPMPRLIRPARRVVFATTSHDQGWPRNRRSEEGSTPYTNSYTWFEAGLERFDESQLCGTSCVSDVRYETLHSQAPALSNCALRSIQPVVVPLDDAALCEEEAGKLDLNKLQYHFAHPLHMSPKFTVQKNRFAEKQFTSHQITWSYLDDVQPDTVGAEALERLGRGSESGSGDFVRGLKLGDVITLWAKARYTGWENHVKKARIDIYWAV